MSVHFRVAELAGLYGLNSDTLRYYEEQGLLHPRRDANGYRAYSIADLCDLNVIRALRELDVGIPEIRDYLSGRCAASSVISAGFRPARRAASSICRRTAAMFSWIDIT